MAQSHQPIPSVVVEWLTWCDNQRREQVLQQQLFNRPHPNQCYFVQHVGNGGEYRIPGTDFHVDGFDFTTNTVYEFHGCFWHGCPRCYPIRHESHLRHYDRTMQDVYETTQQRTQQLRELGYRVIEMWECDWSRLKDTSLDIRTYLGTLDLTEPLNPRDAFCGGRTNAVKLYHRVTPSQQIHYIDVTSLYPWVNKTCVYPKGHPCVNLQPSTHRHQPLLWTRSNAKSCRHVISTILSCLTVMTPNSFFLSVLPVWNKRCPNDP